MVASELGWSFGVGQGAGTRVVMLSVASGNSYQNLATYIETLKNVHGFLEDARIK